MPLRFTESVNGIYEYRSVYLIYLLEPSAIGSLVMLHFERPLFAYSTAHPCTVSLDIVAEWW